MKNELKLVQRELDEHNGQLKVLMTFVQASLKEQVEMSAERAASRQIEKLIAPRSAPPADGAKE